MSVETKPTFLLVGNPQTSKNSAMQSTDLLSVRSFSSVVKGFDTALDLPHLGSLHPDRQIASVVMSVAAHRAFVLSLEERLYPGLIDPEKRGFSLVYTGHSVGEMAAFIESGVCGIQVMARMLRERERITAHPIGAGFRQMVAIVGADPDILETRLNDLTARFAGQAEVLMANYNTPRQAVVALKGLGGEVKSVIENLGVFISELKNPDDPEKFLFPRIKLFPLLPNAFHTAGMAVEQAIYKKTIEPWLTEEFFRAPGERTLYSPTLPGWVEDLESVYSVAGNILTKPVKFTRAMHDLVSIPNLAAIVTADVLGTTPNMIRENGIKIPVLNVVNKQSLNESIAEAARLLH